ncbi:MAG: hypothetical protein GOMPHAMPRED_000104 [Gomphillus americanus]|uniref:Uncharacterized protein n=1 Tax=Gomphillus americanus TaxID=1940652 RepID=A0A8H3EFQ8_9LECA|nr:MAG: hypothetical protein GOMPHAMPRED_000104 [Gomphillus americanus]
MSSNGRVEHQWQNAGAGLEEVVEESMSETSFEQQPPPRHPIPTMQGAFEESILEEPEESTLSKKDSVFRRKILLERPQYQRIVGSKWTQKPGEKFHPLWKLVSQLAFGMHLLHQELAKSEEEVIKILQTHVDEVDGFLERTTEDFDLAQHDINERIRYLQLPLEHGEVFDTMLTDRAFRTAMVEGNIKIEHIVDRTSMALTDSLKDVKKGSDGTKELARYLRRLEKTWYVRDDTITEVFHAMMGNTEGWTAALQGLQEKGKLLSKSLEHLRAIIAEIQRLVGIASRRNVPQQYTPLTAQYGRSAVTSQSPPGSRSPEDNDIIASSFAMMSNDSTSRIEQEPNTTVYEERNRSSPALHANPILEEEDESDQSDHFPISLHSTADASARIQAPIEVNASVRTPPEDDAASSGHHETSHLHTRDLTQDDRTDLKHRAGVSALGAIASVATESNATISTSRSQLHDDTDRLTSRPSGRAAYVPRPEVIEEEDEDSDDSGYTADIIGSAPITSMAPIPSPVENRSPQFPSPTDQANESHESDQVPDYSPPKIEFRSSIPKPAETKVNEATKEFTLPPLDLESETPLPVLTPLDYERMRADRIIPDFDLKVPEEYVKSDSSAEIRDSESKATISDLAEPKAIETKAAEPHEIKLPTIDLDPTNIEKPKTLSHPFQHEDSAANPVEQTIAAHSIISSIDNSSSSSDATPMSVPLAEQRNVYHEESPRSVYTEIPWLPEFENDDAISYSDQYVPRLNHLIPDHLLPPRSDSLNLNSDQFVPHPDQFYQDSKRSSGQFIPHPDQFYQDSRSEYSVKMGLLTSDIPRTAEFAVHTQADKTSDSSSSISEGQLVDDMKTPVQNSHAIFPGSATGPVRYEQESPPSEDEKAFPLPPHAEVFTRTQSMSKDIHRKPVPRPQQREAPKSDSAKQVPAAISGLATTTAATAIAVNEASESDTPTLTKGPRQLPIDDLLIRLRHGAGLVTPTEPDPKPDLTIDSRLSETQNTIDSPDKRNSEIDDDLLISPRNESTALQFGPDRNKELPLKQHDEVGVTHQANAEPVVHPIQADPVISARPVEPIIHSIQAEPIIHSVQLKSKDLSYASVQKDNSMPETGQISAETYTQQQQHQGTIVDESTLGLSEPPVIGLVPMPETRLAPTQGAGQLNSRIEAQRELPPPQINIQHEQSVPAISRRLAILEPRLQRRASYSDNRTTQRISTLQQSSFAKNGLLSPDFVNLSPKQYPHSALVPASSPWTFFSKDDMDHSYRRRRAHSLYSPATPYDLEWLLRRTPSDMAVSPMRWSEIYGWRSGQSSAVSPLGYPFGARSNPISPMKQGLSIDNVLDGTKSKSTKIEAPLAATTLNSNLMLTDLDAVRGQLSQAAEVKPIQPAWREPTLREQKADRPAIRVSSIYSKAPDLDLEYSPPIDLPRIVRTETGYESFYSQTQPSSAYTDMTFGQISPAPAISSAKPSPLHFVSRDRIPDAPASPRSPKEEPKFPLEISDEKQTVVEMPPVSPGLKSLTSATVTGPEPDFPFLSATYGGPEPDYYYYSTSFDEPEETSPRRTNSELAAPNATEKSRNEHPQQDNGMPQPSAANHNENEQQQQSIMIDTEDSMQSSQPGSFPTAYRQNSMSKRREGPPPALSLKLFPSMDSMSRAAISPRSPRPQDLIAESGRSMVTLPIPNLSTSNLMPPVTQEQAAPVTAQKPNRSPLKKLFKDALSPSLLTSRLKRDKSHRRGRSSIEKSLAKDAAIANAQTATGMAQTHGLNGTSDSASSLLRKGSMPVLPDGRRPSGERVLYGMPGSDGNPF